MYFSGFCLKDEYSLFELDLKQFDVAGFSYGAIKAFDYAFEKIKNHKRVNKLILLSPAFFQNEDNKFKRMQLIHFKKNKSIYINNFIKNVTYPSDIKIDKYLKEGTFDELKELLYYTWDKKKIDFLIQNGVKLEVYLGKKDKIIDTIQATNFFKEFGEVYFIKQVGHILR